MKETKEQIIEGRKEGRIASLYVMKKSVCVLFLEFCGPIDPIDAKKDIDSRCTIKWNTWKTDIPSILLHHAGNTISKSGIWAQASIFAGTSETLGKNT